MTGTLQACLVRNQADECRPCTIISSAIRCASGGVAEAISVRKWVELPRPPGQEFALSNREHFSTNTGVQGALPAFGYFGLRLGNRTSLQAEYA